MNFYLNPRMETQTPTKYNMSLGPNKFTSKSAAMLSISSGLLNCISHSHCLKFSSQVPNKRSSGSCMQISISYFMHIVALSCFTQTLPCKNLGIQPMATPASFSHCPPGDHVIITMLMTCSTLGSFSFH